MKIRQVVLMCTIPGMPRRFVKEEQGLLGRGLVGAMLFTHEEALQHLFHSIPINDQRFYSAIPLDKAELLVMIDMVLES